MNKQEIANRVLWTAYIFALIASSVHMAWVFGTLEFGSRRWVGWLAAIAVNISLAALAYMTQQRRWAHRSTTDLWLGVAGLVGVSAFANLLHALAVQTQGEPIVLATLGAVDVLDLIKAISMSAILPLLVVYLGNIVGSDDVAHAGWCQQALDVAKSSSTAEPTDTQAKVSLPQWRPGLEKTISAIRARLASKASASDTASVSDEDQVPQPTEETVMPTVGLESSTGNRRSKDVTEAAQIARLRRLKSRRGAVPSSPPTIPPAIRRRRDSARRSKRHRRTQPAAGPARIARLQRRMLSSGRKGSRSS